MEKNMKKMLIGLLLLNTMSSLAQFRSGDRVYFESQNEIWKVESATINSVTIDGPSFFTDFSKRLSLEDAKEELTELVTSVELEGQGLITKSQSFTTKNGDFFYIKEILEDGRVFAHPSDRIASGGNRIIGLDEIESLGVRCVENSDVCVDRYISYDGDVYRVLAIMENGSGLIFERGIDNFLIIDLKENTKQGYIEVL